MKKYKIQTYSFAIEEVEIIRETDKMIVKKDWKGKDRKESNRLYFNSMKEAAEAIIYREKVALDVAQDRYNWHLEKLKKAESQLNKYL